MKVEAGSEIIRKPYGVDGEIGRFTFESHEVRLGEQKIYDTSTEVFPAVHGKGWYRTRGFKEIAYVHGTLAGSYRKTTGWLNRVRHQSPEEGTPVRTLHDNVEAEGQQLQAYWEQWTQETLAAHGFQATGQPQMAPDREGAVTCHPLAVSEVEKAREKLKLPEVYTQQFPSNPVSYEDPGQSVWISLDKVGVKRQKDSRPELPKEEDPKTVQHTVAHLCYGQSHYTLNGASVTEVLLRLIAFLAHHELLQHNLVFFLDGERALAKALTEYFGEWARIQIILDWHHLAKKCRDLVGVAAKDKDIRDAVLKQILLALWYGDVPQALQVLKSLDHVQLKLLWPVKNLIEYLERQLPHIPCYALRRALHLGNSSNRVEKANDLLVSARQKHNGMSWSTQGSVSLALLSALDKNQEAQRWFRYRTLSFAFAA